LVYISYSLRLIEAKRFAQQSAGAKKFTATIF